MSYAPLPLTVGDMNPMSAETQPVWPTGRLQRLATYLRTVGLRTTLQLGLCRLRGARRSQAPRALRLQPARVRHPLSVRTGNSSDVDVFWQIFLMEEYECLADLPEPKLILDLGANVGYASAYFLNRFPKARVVAVEPDPENCRICRRNLAPYGARARVVAGAAWPERTSLALSRGAYGDGREWATQVRERATAEDGDRVEGWDMASLMEMAGADQVDLLKVDIERSEIELFGRNVGGWLPRVRNICIELHGPDCREAFFRALAGYEYALESWLELTICRNLRRSGA